MKRRVTRSMSKSLESVDNAEVNLDTDDQKSAKTSIVRRCFQYILSLYPQSDPGENATPEIVLSDEHFDITPIRHFRHDAYRDSKPRPLMRGWLHALVAAILFVSIIASASFPDAVGTVLGFRAEQLAFLIGKWCSYTASATYHTYDFRDRRWLRFWNIMDLAMCPMSLYGVIACSASASWLTKDSSQKFFFEFYLFLIALSLNTFGVWLQFRTEPPGSATFRSSVILYYYFYSEFILYNLVVGERPFFAAFEDPNSVPVSTQLWYATVPSYMVAVIFAFNVDCFRMKEPVCLSHHKSGFWSLHEDFHVVLFISDLVSLFIFLSHNR